MFVLLGNLAARLEETYSLESRVEVSVCVALLRYCVLFCVPFSCVFGVFVFQAYVGNRFPCREDEIFIFLVAISCV